MTTGSFELIAEVSPPYCPSVKLFKWRSQRTGLQVVLIQRKSPSVQGYFAVATEANDNSGCPHTLEHIVFMGSKKYPYNGLLDKLSAKMLSSTNAWTAQDQTCYTLTTAGFEGFANLLPVYLDHILHATVNESACVTEVYHIDAKGEEKGVVFSEMQQYEHLPETLSGTAIQKLLYTPDSGYATNTGGSLDALRELKPETIKKYHRDVYSPENLSVIVTGDVQPAELLQVLEPFDGALQPRSEKAKRPFVESPYTNQPSPLTENAIHIVDFPDSSEVSGEVQLSWLGPRVTDLVNSTALQVVLTYLTMTGAGKLQTRFVNVSKEQALASQISAYTSDYLREQVNVPLYGVPTEKLEVASNEMLQFLSSEILESLDYPFLQQSLDRVYEQFVMNAEDDWATFVELAITEFLYGNESDTFSRWTGSTDEFTTLRDWSENDWRSFISTYIVKPPKACVIARPSKNEQNAVAAEKERRSQEIQTTCNLEEEGLKLDLAVKNNDQEIPKDLLNMFAPPDLTRIRFITSDSAATKKLVAGGLPGAPLQVSSALQDLVGKTDDLDLAINFESFPTQFVTIKVYIDTRNIDKRLFHLIEPVLSHVFALPMELEDGRKLEGKEVAQEVKRSLLSSYLSVDYQIQEFVIIEVQAKAENYETAVNWIKRAMRNVVYDETYASMFIARHLKSVAESKRDESALLASSVDELLLSDESLRRQADILISESAVLDAEQNISQTVEDLKHLAKQLFRRENLRVLVLGDIPTLAKQSEVLKPWKSLANEVPGVGTLTPVPTTVAFLSEHGKKPAESAIVTTCAASDSSSVNIVASGPSSYRDEDLPALAVVNEYLTMAEGPFWKAVRGSGLAYGASVQTSVQLGKIICSIHAAADAPAATLACRKVVEDISSGKDPVNEEGLASAVSTIVGQLAVFLAQPSTAVKEKFVDTVLKGYEPGYTKIIIEKIRAVTVEKFLKTLRTYLLPLFNARSSAIFAVVPPSEQATIEEAFTKMGYAVTVKVADVGDYESGSDGYDSEEEFESD